MLYKAIYFDWDGTAVLSRTSPLDSVLKPMISLLEKNIKLIIISGTTYEKIAKGELHKLIPENCQKNLFLGLGRGAYNYGFKNGEMYILSDYIPNIEYKIKLDNICFTIHKILLEQYQLITDIVFSRPNYCKIDLMVDNNRQGNLFLQDCEIDKIGAMLEKHGIKRGLNQIIELCNQIAENQGLAVKVTTDAKYLEIGFTTKSDNVNFFAEHFNNNYGISVEESCFLGDEFTQLSEGIYGSDSQMITEITKSAKFFDVSNNPRRLPSEVEHIGGGVQGFINFLEYQIN